MLLYPPTEKLIKKIGSPFKLAVIVGKRARFLQQNLTEEQKEVKKEVSRAVEEVYLDKIISD